MTKDKTKEPTIEDLPGVGAATAEKLRESGYTSLMSLAVASPGELTEAAGVGEAVARKIISTARNSMKMDFLSGEDLLKRRESITKISSGSKNVDGLIGGGFESGGITEAYGAFGCGKTNIAHQLAVMAQLPTDKGGTEGMVVWIDTENSFRPERISQIAKARGIDPLEALKNIKYVRAFNSDHQMVVAEKVEELITNQKLPIKLLIVDSLMAHFRSEFVGRGQLADRQQKLNKHMHILMKLADVYNLCVYVTNQVMAKPDTFFGDPTAAIGGNIVAHNCLVEGTLIQLPDGRIRPIEEIFNETDVLSIDLKNSLKSKSAKIQTIAAKKKDKVYNIQTTNRISSSAEHRFFTLENFGIKEVMAKDLKLGQYVAHGFNFAIEGQLQTLPEVKVPQLVTISTTGKQLILNSICCNRKELCTNLNLTPRQFRRVLNQGYPTESSNIQQLISSGVPEGLNDFTKKHYTNKHKELIVPKVLDKDLAQIFGYFLGDGNLDKRSIRFKDERHGVLDFYRQLFMQLTGIEGAIKKVSKKKCYALQINSVALVKLFALVKAELFDYIGKSPDICVAAFIRGFFDADGSIDEKSGTVSAAQKDDEVIQKIQLFLDRLGIRSRLRKYNHKGHWINQLGIRDNKNIILFSKMIGFTAADKQEKLEKRIAKMRFSQQMTPIKREDLKAVIKEFGEHPSNILRPRKSVYVGEAELKKVISRLIGLCPLTGQARDNLNFLITLAASNLRWEQVHKITIENTQKTFYDFGAETMENYLANGFCVHNSQTRLYLRRGKGGTRVAKLVDSPHLPDGEACFTITEEGIIDA